MNKIGHVAIVVVIVAIVYLIMLVVMPVVVDIAATANATANATSNMSQYPGGSEILIAAPWVLWFVPAGIGMISVVIILKRE
jgi:hypothetical protein